MPRIKVDGIELSYRDSGGEGTPVVLIHGFPFDATLWDPQFEELGARFRLIAPDLRGFGDSSVPDDPADLSMTAFADDVAALLDHLEVPRAVVGGLSMGGYVTFEFLRRHPAKVAGLLLADTRPDADSAEVRERRETQIRQVTAQGAAGLVDAMIRAVLSEHTRTQVPAAQEALRKVMDQDDRAWIGGLQAMLDRGDSTGDLGGITVPTLLVVGEHDAVTPPEVARLMHERIPGSRLVAIEDAGHVSNLESPTAFNDAVAGFLGEL